VIKIAVVGLGKMGLSHLAIVKAHPEVELAAVCDSSSYVLGVLKKYTGVATYSDYDLMLRELDLDAVLIATPSRTHAGMVRKALERRVHVFCEKPFTLSIPDAEELTALAREKSLVTQVGYHNRFVGAFAEVKGLLDAGAIGKVTHVLGEAYGSVVLKSKGGTWRSRRRRAAARSTTTPRIHSISSTGTSGRRSASAERSSIRSSRARSTTRCTARFSMTKGSAHASRSTGPTSRIAR